MKFIKTFQVFEKLLHYDSIEDVLRNNLITQTPLYFKTTPGNGVVLKIQEFANNFLKEKAAIFQGPDTLDSVFKTWAEVMNVFDEKEATHIIVFDNFRMTKELDQSISSVKNVLENSKKFGTLFIFISHSFHPENMTESVIDSRCNVYEITKEEYAKSDKLIKTQNNLGVFSNDQ